LDVAQDLKILISEPYWSGLAAERKPSLIIIIFSLVTDNLRYNQLITLRYGLDHEDLVRLPYLITLPEDPSSDLAADTSARRMTVDETSSGL
jgi:hypothetical protein